MNRQMYGHLSGGLTNSPQRQASAEPQGLSLVSSPYAGSWIGRLDARRPGFRAVIPS
jgi:hypothetical protein